MVWGGVIFESRVRLNITTRTGILALSLAVKVGVRFKDLNRSIA